MEHRSTRSEVGTRNPVPVRGRGATFNPANRFEQLHYESQEAWDGRPARLDFGEDGQDAPATLRPTTKFLRDESQSIISYNDSPDVGFNASLNPYRGCEHGCAYCYARPTHEYLGFSAGLDFESKILVKLRAAELLRAELSSKGWKPQVLNLSGVTDCYQPIERKLEITRSCLQVLAEFRNPAFVVTKNRLVVRDVDLLAELARFDAAGVAISITTLSPDLAQKLEPRASLPQARLDAVARLREAGILVGVMAAPIIPGLNDHEIPRILSAAAKAGGQFASYTIVRLPLSVAPIFCDWLAAHFPNRKEKILGRIRSMREGKLNSSEFGRRMRGEGFLAEQIHRIFVVSSQRYGLDRISRQLSSAAFRRVQRNQPELGL
jgi:DNA repair photolyase